MKSILKLIAAVAFVLWFVTPAPSAGAEVPCEHRSAEHAAESHTTREGDSRWHVLHGQLPTCGLGDSSEGGNTGEHRNSDDGPRRDHPGYHCTWHGCG